MTSPRRRPGYPIHLMHLDGAPVLLVGGGAVAAEKLPALLRAGARVHVVAPALGPTVASMRDQLASVSLRPFQPDDVEGHRLVMSATDDPEVTEAVVAEARRRGILVNAADAPDLCDFYVPASLVRGPSVLSVSTNGGSPLLAGRFRRFVDAVLPDALSDLGELFVAMRHRGLKGVGRRSSLLRALASPTVGGFVDRGDRQGALDRIEALLADEAPFAPGSVAIVGAGPGSVGHLTLDALDRLQRADIVLHDALVQDEVLALVPAGAVLEMVGRRCASEATGRQLTRQERVQRVVDAARRGLRVVRLHAGDPFVFGCGGEEVEALTAAGIPYEICPGISSVMAAPAAAGVPLTRRGVARGFTVRTGHLRSGPTAGELPPEEETVVVLMGLSSLEDVVSHLCEEGRPSTTPAVAVSSASREGEQVVLGTLADIALRVREAGLRSPTTLVVGEVARHAVAASALAAEVAA